MTKYERERIAAEIKRQNKEVDAKVDSFLDKLKASKWTGAILLAGVVVFLAAIFF